MAKMRERLYLHSVRDRHALSYFEMSFLIHHRYFVFQIFSLVYKIGLFSNQSADNYLGWRLNCV